MGGTSLFEQCLYHLAQSTLCAHITGEDDIGRVREGALLAGLPNGNAGGDLTTDPRTVYPQRLYAYIAGGNASFGQHKGRPHCQVGDQ